MNKQTVETRTLYPTSELYYSSSSFMLALEPRIMFDGAAVATADAATSEPAPEPVETQETQDQTPESTTDTSADSTAFSTTSLERFFSAASCVIASKKSLFILESGLQFQVSITTKKWDSNPL